MAAVFILVLFFSTLGVSGGAFFTENPIPADDYTPYPEPITAGQPLVREQHPVREQPFDPFPGAQDSQRFSAGEMTGEGTCLCTVQLPAEILCTDYQAKQNLEKLRGIKQQISKLTHDVDKLLETTARHAELFAAFESNLTEVTTTFDLIEGGQVIVTRVEIEGVLTRIRYMESTLYALRKWHGIESEAAHKGKIQNMLDEASNITRIVDAMASQDFTDSSAALQRQISSLADQLKSCTDRTRGSETTTPAGESPGEATTAAPPDDSSDAEESETLPELWPRKEKQNSCGRLVGISEPYTVRGSLDSTGTWMRDPIKNSSFVYFHKFKSSSSSSRVTTAFKTSSSVRFFQRNEAHQITGEATEDIVESVVYNGSIYAYSKRSRSDYDYHYRQQPQPKPKLIKISFASTSPSFSAFATSGVLRRRDVTETELEQASYRPTTVPKMDLTVDETGLWLLYGDSLGMLTVSQLDQDTLQFPQTLRGAYPKNRLANCFVVCAKVYCLNSYTEYDAKVSYFMDTETGFEGFTNVPFIIKYGSLSSIEYNPRDQMLYGWDNGHAVVYSLTFE